MAFPVAPGHPQLSGSYIPTLYAAALLKALYTATVFAAIANTDYEGQIKDKGDKVVVRLLPAITIRDYVKGQDLIYEKPTPSTRELTIDRGKYWAMEVNLVDKRQSDLAFVDAWAEHASESMKIEMDSDILGDIYGSVHASNAGAAAGVRSGGFDLGAAGSPIALTPATIVGKIVDCGTVLDEQNCPETGRWMVLPAWACNYIKRSELKDASLSGDGKSMLRNGRIGMIDRFELFSSNNVATSVDGANTCSNIVFGHKRSLTFASQLVKTDVLTNPNDFGDLLRGLNVFGFEVIEPEIMGHLYAYKGSASA